MRQCGRARSEVLRSAYGTQNVSALDSDCSERSQEHPSDLLFQHPGLITSTMQDAEINRLPSGTWASLVTTDCGVVRSPLSCPAGSLKHLALGRLRTRGTFSGRED